MSTKYFEEREYYRKEYETHNGLEREAVDREYKTKGEPFESRFSDRFRDFANFDIPLSRFYDDWNKRPANRSSSQPTDFRRKTSAPPTRRPDIIPPSQAPREFPPSSTTRTDYSHVRNVPTIRSRGNDSDITYTVIQPPVKSTVSSKYPRPTTSNDASGSLTAAAGDIINTEHGFTIQLNAKNFSPKEIKITLAGSSLSITGEHIEDGPTLDQSLKRSFSRRYAIPDEIKLETIKSHMTENGLLVISGERKAWKQTALQRQAQTNKKSPITDV